ncbi:hypothetical protein B0H67DRAFT_120667 [Lasiosphaeris hirsuta]|uniref:Uncharacterized protein n=1 Tax=Lasiosphaeris hirsuta TaxID=260670 RepID=A0AA40E215_9PEZI|nr:hypothetical protein B0H67DRAFT_120667 [Lasiosphaeris hirsuta]
MPCVPGWIMAGLVLGRSEVIQSLRSHVLCVKTGGGAVVSYRCNDAALQVHPAQRDRYTALLCLSSYDLCSATTGSSSTRCLEW